MQKEDLSRNSCVEAAEKCTKYHLFVHLNCPDCDCAQPPSADGKIHFIGCTDWRKVEEWDHIYAPIPAPIDETILFQLMNNQQVNSPDIDKYEGGCLTFIHPQHGKVSNLPCSIFCICCGNKVFVLTLISDRAHPFLQWTFCSWKHSSPWVSSK